MKIFEFKESYTTKIIQSDNIYYVLNCLNGGYEIYTLPDNKKFWSLITEKNYNYGFFLKTKNKELLINLYVVSSFISSYLIGDNEVTGVKCNDFAIDYNSDYIICVNNYAVWYGIRESIQKFFNFFLSSFVSDKLKSVTKSCVSIFNRNSGELNVIDFGEYVDKIDDIQVADNEETFAISSHNKVIICDLE